MNRLLHIALATLLSFALAATAIAQSADPAAELQSARDEYAEVLGRFEQVRDSYDRQTAEIDVLKTQVATSPLVALELQRALRASQSTADELLALDAQLGALTSRIGELGADARAALLADIASLEAQLASATPSERPALIASLNERTEMLGAWETPLPGYAPVPIEEILAQIVDTPEELYATADELADHADRVQRQLEEIERRLEEAEARERLEQRARALALEESFFEDGIARRPARPSSEQAEPTTGGASRGGATAAEDSPNEASEDTPNRGGGVAVGGAFDDMETDTAAPDMPDDDGAMSGGAGGAGDEFGGTDDLGTGAPTLQVDPVETTSTATLAGQGGLTAGIDPTDASDVRGDADDGRRGRRRGSEADELRARQAQLARDLQALEAERTRLVQRAEELEEGGFK